MGVTARRLGLFFITCAVMLAGATGWGQAPAYRPVTEAMAANPYESPQEPSGANHAPMRYRLRTLLELATGVAIIVILG